MMMGSVLEDDTDVGQLIEGQRHEPARVRAGKGRVEASDVLAIGVGDTDVGQLIEGQRHEKMKQIAAQTKNKLRCTYSTYLGTRHARATHRIAPHALAKMQRSTIRFDGLLSPIPLA